MGLGGGNQLSQAQGGTGISGQSALGGGGGGGFLPLLSMLIQGGNNANGGGGLLSSLFGGGQNQQVQGGAAAPSPGDAGIVNVQTPLFTQYGLPSIQTPQGQGAAGDIGGTQAGMNPINYLMQQYGSGTRE
jgi:hypothetical protein